MINLEKGGRINLSKDSDGNKLSKIFFGANWGAIKSGGFMGFGSKRTEAVDLDASIVLLDSDKKKVETVYFGHKTSTDRAICHSGDDLVGDTEGDDGMDNETISVELNGVSPRVEYIVFILNSFRNQRFDKIPYMGLRIYSTSTGRPVTRPSDTPNVLAKYNLDNDSKDADTTFVGREAIILGYAYRKDGEWKFKALGNTGTWGSIGEIERVLPNFI